MNRNSYSSLSQLAVAARPGSDRDRRARRAGPARRARTRSLPRRSAARRLLVVRTSSVRAGESRSNDSLVQAWPITSSSTSLYGVRERDSEPMSESKLLQGPELLGEIGRLAADKKAIDIVELDLRGVLGYTDYFLICSGNTVASNEGDP